MKCCNSFVYGGDINDELLLELTNFSECHTRDDAHTRSCSFVAPGGGFILLKSPDLSLGVGTSRVL